MRHLGSCWTGSNYGGDWINIGWDLPANIEASFLATLGDELVLATDNAGLFLSSNNKTRWRQIGRDLPGKKINALLVDGNTIYVGVYQKGVFKGDASDLLWESLNYNLTDLLVQSLAIYGNDLFVGRPEYWRR